MIEIVEPTEERLAYLAEHMREWDKFECEAAGVTPLKAVIDGCKCTKAAILSWDGTPLAVYGHRAITDKGGLCWELGTDGIDRHKKECFEAGNKIIAEMLDEHEWLTNVVCMENKKSVRWLTRLGAVFLPETRIELLGKPFERFYLWR